MGNACTASYNPTLLAEYMDTLPLTNEPFSKKLSACHTMTSWCDDDTNQQAVAQTVLSEIGIAKISPIINQAVKAEDEPLVVAVLDLLASACRVYELGGVRALPLALESLKGTPSEDVAAAAVNLLHAATTMPKSLSVLLTTPNQHNNIETLKHFADTAVMEPPVLQTFMKTLAWLSQFPDVSKALAKLNFAATFVDASCVQSYYGGTQRHALVGLARLCKWDVVLDYVNSQNLLTFLSARCLPSSHMELALVYAQCSNLQTHMIPEDPKECLTLLTLLLHSGSQDNVVAACWAISNYATFPPFREVLVKSAALAAMMNLSRRLREVRLWKSVVICLDKILQGSREDKELCLRLDAVGLLIEVMDGCLDKVSSNVEEAIVVDIANIKLLAEDHQDRMKTWTLALGCLAKLMDVFASACVQFMKHSGYSHFPAILAADENPQGQAHAATIISHLLRHDSSTADVFLENTLGDIVKAMARSAHRDVQLGCSQAICELLATKKGQSDGPRVLLLYDGVRLCARVAFEADDNGITDVTKKLFWKVLEAIMRACVIPNAVAHFIAHPNYEAIFLKAFPRDALAPVVLRLMFHILKSSDTHEGAFSSLLAIEGSVAYVISFLDVMNPIAAHVLGVWSTDPETVGVITRYKQSFSILVQTLSEAYGLMVSGGPKAMVGQETFTGCIQTLANILLTSTFASEIEKHKELYDIVWDAYVIATIPLNTKMQLLRCMLSLVQFPAPPESNLPQRMQPIVDTLTQQSIQRTKTLTFLSVEILWKFVQRQPAEACQQFAQSCSVGEALVMLMSGNDRVKDFSTPASCALESLLEKVPALAHTLFTQDVVDKIWSTFWEAVTAEVVDDVPTIVPSAPLNILRLVKVALGDHIDIHAVGNSQVLFDLATDDPNIELRKAAVGLIVTDKEVLKARAGARNVLCAVLGAAADLCQQLETAQYDVQEALLKCPSHATRYRLLRVVEQNEQHMAVNVETAKYCAHGLFFMLNYVDGELRSEFGKTVLDLTGSGWPTLFQLCLYCGPRSVDAEIELARLTFAVAVETQQAKEYLGDGGIPYTIAILANTTMPEDVRALSASALQSCCRVDFFCNFVAEKGGLQILMGLLSRKGQTGFNTRALLRSVLTDVIIVLAVASTHEPEIGLLFVSKGHLQSITEIQREFLSDQDTAATLLHQSILRLLTAMFTKCATVMPLTTKQEAVGNMLEYLALIHNPKVVRTSSIALYDLARRDDQIVECILSSSRLPYVNDCFAGSDDLCLREVMRLLVVCSQRSDMRRLLRTRLIDIIYRLCIRIIGPPDVNPLLFATSVEFLASHVVDNGTVVEMESLRPNLSKLIAQTTTIDDRMYALMVVKGIVGNAEDPIPNADVLVAKLISIVHTDHTALLARTLDVLRTLAATELSVEIAAFPNICDIFLKRLRSNDARESVLCILAYIMKHDSVRNAFGAMSDENLKSLLELAGAESRSEDSNVLATYALHILTHIATFPRLPLSRLTKLVEAMALSFRCSVRVTMRSALSLRALATALPIYLKHNDIPPAQSSATCREVLHNIKVFLQSKHPSVTNPDEVLGQAGYFDSTGMLRSNLAPEDDVLWNALPKIGIDEKLSAIQTRKAEWECAYSCAVAVAISEPVLAAQTIAIEDVFSLFTKVNDLSVHILAAKMLAALARLKAQHEVMLAHKSIGLLTALLTHATPGIVHCAAFGLAQLSDNVRTHRKLVQIIDVESTCRTAGSLLDEQDSVFVPMILFQIGRLMTNISGSVHFQGQMERGGRVAIARVQNALSLQRSFADVFELQVTWQAALVDPSWVPLGMVDETTGTANGMSVETCVDELIKSRTSRPSHPLDVITHTLCIFSRVEARRVKAVITSKCQNPVQVLGFHLQNQRCVMHLLWTLFFLCALDVQFSEAVLEDSVLPFIQIANTCEITAVKYVACKVLCVLWGSSNKSRQVFARAKYVLKLLQPPFEV